MSPADKDEYAGRTVSRSTPSSGGTTREVGTVQLTDLSVRAIGLYQKQSELTDRLWAYFGTYSGMAVLAGLLAPILAENSLIPTGSNYMIALFCLTVFCYAIFSYSNREALKVSQEALGLIAAQAAVASGIPLVVVKTARAMSFHKLVSLVILVTMVVGFVSAASVEIRSKTMAPTTAAPAR